MMNIPTDLLRTLIAVVDLRSFTKAAQSFGVTQPAVSAQIKRLQFLLGFELLDKSAPGISLTARGHEVVKAARQMLSINDHILGLTSGGHAARTLRVCISGDFIGARLPALLANFHRHWPFVRFIVNGGSFEQVQRGLQMGELDLAIAVAKSEPTIPSRHLWTDPAVWVRSEATQIDPHRPVPLVSLGDECSCRQTAVQALNRVGRTCEFVYTSRSIVGLEAAVDAGMGVMVLPRSRVGDTCLSIWDDAPLPSLPDLYCGVFLREGSNWAPLEGLADEIGAVLRPRLGEAAEHGTARRPVRMMLGAG
jgi:DNA-binding transcriptional LysR family regulator